MQGYGGEIRAFGSSLTKGGGEQFAIAVRPPGPTRIRPLEAAAVLGLPCGAIGEKSSPPWRRKNRDSTSFVTSDSTVPRQTFARAAQVEIECFPLWIGEGVNDGNGVGPGRIRAQIRVEPVIQIDRLGVS